MRRVTTPQHTGTLARRYRGQINRSPSVGDATAPRSLTPGERRTPGRPIREEVTSMQMCPYRQSRQQRRQQHRSSQPATPAEVAVVVAGLGFGLGGDGAAAVPRSPGEEPTSTRIRTHVSAIGVASTGFISEEAVKRPVSSHLFHTLFEEY